MRRALAILCLLVACDREAEEDYGPACADLEADACGDPPVDSGACAEWENADAKARDDWRVSECLPDRNMCEHGGSQTCEQDYEACLSDYPVPPLPNECVEDRRAAHEHATCKADSYPELAIDLDGAYCDGDDECLTWREEQRMECGV